MPSEIYSCTVWRDRNFRPFGPKMVEEFETTLDLQDPDNGDYDADNCKYLKSTLD
jgi:hypothetical protein